MTWYAFVGVLACISKTEVSWNSSLSSFIQCTLIFSMLFQFFFKKKAMLLKITELISQAVHDSLSLQFGKKKSWSWFITVFWGDLPTVICCQGARRENMRFPAARWPSGTESNYTFPLNTPKLSEFQRKYLLTSFSRFCSAGNGKFMRPHIELRRASLVVQR